MDTFTNKMGVTITVGQKSLLTRNFSNTEGKEGFVTEITPSGRYFKVSNHDGLFSTLTFHLRGTFMGSTYVELIK